MEPNALLDSIFENGPYPMWISDDKGTLIRINRACRDLLQIKDDEVVGKYNVLRDELVKEQGLLPMVRLVFEKGKSVRFNLNYDTSRLNLDLKERVSLVLDVTISPVLDSRGRVTHTIVQHIDITGRKRAEELLRESENTYRSIFETTGTATIIVEEDMTISLANAELEKLTGYSRAEIEGKKKWTEFVVKEDLEAMREYHYARRKAPGTAPRSYEFRLLDREGKVKNVLLTVALVSGTRKTVASILDITERKRAEEALRESEERWQFALEGAGDGVWDWNAETNQVHFSRQWKAMLGYEESEIGDTLDEWAKRVHPDDYPGAMAEIDKHFKGESPVYTSEHRLLCKGGTYKWILDRGKVIRRTDEGKPLRVIGTHTDITERKERESTLRMFQHSVDNSSDAVFWMNRDAGFSYVNAQACRSLGYSREQLLALHLWDIDPIFPKELWNDQWDRYQPGRRGGGEQIETLHRRKDGSTFPVEVISNHLWIDHTELHVAYVRDITGRKQAEDALRRSEKEAQSLLQETAIMGEIGRIISSTLDIDEVYERFAAEVKKLVPFDRISINEVNVNEGTAVTVYTAGLVIPTRKAGELYPLAGSVAGELLQSRSSLLVQGEAMEEFVMRNPSCSPSYEEGIRSLLATPLVSRDRILGTLLLGSLRPDFYSEQDLKLAEKIGNQIAGAIANVQLFREYRRTWGDLRKSEERYRRLVENSPLGIISVDPKGAITHLNAQMASILGFSAVSAALGVSIYSFSPLMESGVSAKFRHCMELGESGSFEGVYRGKEGEETYFRCHFTPIRDSEKKITGAQAVVEDVSERKRLEDQLAQAQKMEAIGTLAGGIAHDFNNILTGILGYAELASMDIPEDSKAQENLQNSIKSAHRAKNLVQQILAFSRQSKQERKPMDIGPIIKEGLKLLRASLPSTIEIRQNLETDLGSIVADPTQVHQVLMNLCTNASHAMSDKGGVLEVSLGKIDMEAGPAVISAGIEAGPYLRLRVRDTGQGIPPQILKRIFDPYFTTKEAGKGTGLGLAVVHGIVKSHGGGISVSSEAGKGSSFEVYFPRVEGPSSAPEAGKVDPLPLGEHERVLFVDDEKEIGEIGRKFLEHLRYEAVVRTSSLEALELFRSKADQFDLVITDMTMPNMTGEKFAQELLKIRPGMPVILCTGFSEQLTEEKVKAMGIREFAMKPLVMKDLAKTMRRALGSQEKKGRERVIK